MEVLERGDIQFWVRPSVQAAEADTYVLGVQSLFAVLSPAGRDTHRRVRIGRKRLPRAPGDRFWARVERVGSLQRVLGDRVEGEHYTTKTRGARYQPGARPLAHGDYVLVRSEEHLRLSYTIDEEGPGGPEEDDLPRVEAASHLVLWKAAGRGRATWSTAGGPELLDHEGTQLVLVGAKAPLELATLAA